jgi:hypothetical protein
MVKVPCGAWRKSSLTAFEPSHRASSVDAASMKKTPRKRAKVITVEDVARHIILTAEKAARASRRVSRPDRVRSCGSSTAR